MQAVKKSIDMVLLVITSALVIFLTVAAIWQVFTRFVLGDPSIITEEVLRFSLIWIAFLGGAYAFGQDEHLAISFLRDKITGKAHLGLRWLIDLIVIGFALFVLVIGGYTIASATMAELSPILRIPMGLIYGILPVSGVIVIFYQIYNMMNRREVEAPRIEEKGDHKWM
ncbi:TRAP transporter small permease [Marinococcus halotolerans]|uniref:TRAP transporter small permease n=1 Tax=Marinococcus halotolerans TaxID=301092 RepID=UPI0003B38149|nr:TRAP transporter small permease [Marinococcus halotolerans]